MTKFFIFLSVIIMLSSCGFKVVNQSANTKYYVEKVNLIGDKRVNYKIRNQLNTSLNDNNKKPIILNLATKKIKKIKEKNIKNEITKYQITLNVNIEIYSRDNTKLDKIILSKSGDFNVVNEYSKTINNEKKLVETLTDEILDDILDKLSSSNDL